MKLYLMVLHKNSKFKTFANGLLYNQQIYVFHWWASWKRNRNERTTEKLRRITGKLALKTLQHNLIYLGLEELKENEAELRANFLMPPVHLTNGKQNLKEGFKFIYKLTSLIVALPIGITLGMIKIIYRRY